MNLIISVAGLVLCMLGLVQAWAGRQMEENTRRYFIAFFTILTAYVGSNLMGQLAEGYQGAGWVFATQLFIFLESAFSSLLMLLLSGCVAFSFGFYDGFFGPGTGSFLLFSFLLVGFDFLGAAANARALNFASNIAGVTVFGLFGLIDFSYALPMGLSMIVGAWCGARMALKKGTGYVRPLFIAMTTVLIGKQIVDLLK